MGGWKQTLLLIAALGLLTVGCSRSDSPPVQEIQVTIDSEPKQLTAKQETVFHVKVSEPSQQAPLTQAHVTMLLEMKEMDHGENQVDLKEQAGQPGLYEGTGAFPMEGAWMAHIRAEKGGQVHTANVDLQVGAAGK